MNKYHRALIFILITLVMMNQSTSAYAISGSFKDLSGNTVSYSAYEGGYMFLEGFSTTCGYCIEQHPVIERLYNAYKQNVTFVTVSVNSDDTLDTLTAFKAKYPTPWTMGLDDGNLMSTMGFDGTPTMFLVDQAGNVMKKFVGYTDYQVIAYEIEVQIFGVTTLRNPTENVITGAENNNSVISNLLESPVFKAAAGIVLVAIIYIKMTSKP